MQRVVGVVDRRNKSIVPGQPLQVGKLSRSFRGKGGFSVEKPFGGEKHLSGRTGIVAGGGEQSASRNAASSSLRPIRRTATAGALVPFGTLADIHETSGPPLVQRYGMYVSVPLQGNAAPGTSTGDAIKKMEELATKILPPGTTFEWADLGRIDIQDSQIS